MRQKSGTHILTLSAVGISALLLLSACSSDSGNDGSNQPAEDSTAVSDSVATAEVTEAAPTDEPDTATPAAESAVKPVVEEAAGQAVSAGPEMLAADAGKTLYESNCKVCHDAGLLNAPKYGDKMAWSTRLTKDKETLYMHSAKGFNKMPAQAVNGVTDAQVKAAVDYMLASVS
ncbi:MULTISPECIES: c-type cytochrome [Psychrobacter]|uniref:Cytochrome c5 n=1 Tax=Psychrobacter alimentarius TaxID=261164 RepID=A0ABM5ZV13_9GAMM|nr:MULTISPECIES: c-type cytochrome [Psychrobacter]AMT95902.1 Cytochrome c5 [Psychrobacter alimentarius]QCB31677.1 cytochrome c5 family protein [Psychrobacter sp. PAMC27889]